MRASDLKKILACLLSVTMLISYPSGVAAAGNFVEEADEYFVSVSDNSADNDMDNSIEIDIDFAKKELSAFVKSGQALIAASDGGDYSVGTPATYGELDSKKLGVIREAYESAAKEKSNITEESVILGYTDAQMKNLAKLVTYIRNYGETGSDGLPYLQYESSSGSTSSMTRLIYDSSTYCLDFYTFVYLPNGDVVASTFSVYCPSGVIYGGLVTAMYFVDDGETPYWVGYTYEMDMAAYTTGTKYDFIVRDMEDNYVYAPDISDLFSYTVQLSVLGGEVISYATVECTMKDIGFDSYEVITPDGCSHLNKYKVDAVEPTIVKDGNIEYWYCPTCNTCFFDEDCMEKISSGSTVIPAMGEVSSEADKGYNYTIMFYGNGATSGSVNSVDLTSYESKNLPQNKYKKTYYEFAGWNTSPDGTGDWYGDGAAVADLASCEGEFVTLYAQWTPVVYSITYVSDECENPNPTEYTIVSDTITLEVPVRTGYSFEGWFLDKKYKKPVTSILSGSNGNRKIYAKWKVNKYNIEFDSNAQDKGVVSGTMKNLTNKSYDSSITLTKNAYRLPGYVFAGWMTSDGVKYNNKAKVKNLTSENGATVTLYAIWISEQEATQTYSVSFSGNGATKGTVDKMEYCLFDEEIKIPECGYTRKGYSFIGWNTDKYGNGTSYQPQEVVTNLSTESRGSVVLYAQWNKEKYTITYETNGGQNNSANPEFYYVTDGKITLKSPARTGYVFDGWYRDSAYKTRVKQIAKGSAGNLTLYAKWSLCKYKVKLNGNGSTSGKTITMSCMYGKEYGIPECTFKRTGYRFAGWCTTADGTGTYYRDCSAICDLTTKNGATVSLYAQWKPNEYMVVFEPNGAASSGQKCQYFEYGTPQKLLNNTISRKGFAFGGWNTKANGKGKTYKNASEVKNLTSENGGVVRLYAVWKTQKAVNGNIKNPLKASVATTATLQRYSFKPAIKYTIYLDEMIYGDEANAIIANENRFNDVPTSSQQWILMKFYLRNDSTNQKLEASDIIGQNYFFTMSGASCQVADTATFSKDLKGCGIYDIDLYPGASSYVYFAMLVPKSNGLPLMQLNNGYSVSARQALYTWIDTTK